MAVGGRGAEGDGGPRSGGGVLMLDPGAQLPAQASGSRSRTAVPAPSDVSHSPGSLCWKQFRFCGRGAPRQGGRAGGRSRRRGLYDSAGGAGRRGWGAGGRALPPAGPLLPICGRKDPPLLVTLTVQLGPQAPSPLLVTLRQEQGREPASQAPGSQTGPTLGERGEGGRPASSSPGRKGK